MVIIEDLNVALTDKMLRQIAARTKKRIDLAASRFAARLQKKLTERTPVYTGASKGVVISHLHSTHPARYIDHTDLGWKSKVDGSKAEGFTITLSNAMWDAYLKYVEYGMQYHGPNKNAYFVRVTLLNFMTSERLSNEDKQ